MSIAKGRFGALVLAALLAAAACAFGINALATPQAAYADGTQEMYRLYNPNSGEHFYTASAVERDTVRRAGWSFEGVGWIAPASSESPVYRLYNANGGEHHYTLDASERDTLVSLGWNDEGTGWYSDDAETIPLYRQYNPNQFANNHNYTTSAEERDSLVGIGWKDENIGWYATQAGYEGVGNGLLGMYGPTLTIEDDPADASIEGTMNLQGTGTGYHGKLVVSSGAEACSFGIQYDQMIAGSLPQVSNHTTYLVENVRLNGDGSINPEYMYLNQAPVGEDVKVRISWYKETKELRFYVNDQLTGMTTCEMQPKYFEVEGSAAHHGDSINTAVKDVHVKAGDKGITGSWDVTNNNYFGLQVNLTKNGSIITSGPFGTNGMPTYGCDFTITGTANIPGNNPATGQPWDWDNCFGAVEPNTGTTGHAISGIAIIAQR